MKLRNRSGVIVSVSDEKAERLLKSGYTEVGQDPKSEEQPAPKRRGRPKKTTESER